MNPVAENMLRLRRHRGMTQAELLGLWKEAQV